MYGDADDNKREAARLAQIMMASYNQRMQEVKDRHDLIIPRPEPLSEPKTWDPKPFGLEPWESIFYGPSRSEPKAMKRQSEPTKRELDEKMTELEQRTFGLGLSKAAFNTEDGAASGEAAAESRVDEKRHQEAHEENDHDAELSPWVLV